MNTITTTKVKFYIDNAGGVFAYFPDQIENASYDRLCYSHVGQHSSCSENYIKRLRMASPDEYRDLLMELKSIGYDDLEIIDKRKTISKILEPVNCKNGAPMGRPNVGTEPLDKEIFQAHVRLYDGYDKGGAYWGSPSTLYVKYTKDLSYIEFYRI